MSAAPAPRSEGDPPKPRIYRRRRFWVIVVLLAALLALAASAAWIGFRALQAKSELESAQALIPRLKSEAIALDVTGAESTLKKVTAHTGRATELTSDPLWHAAESMPMLGVNLSAVRQLSVVTDSVMSDVAEPLLSVAGTVDPASLAPKDGAIDVKPFADAVPVVARANAGLKSAKQQMKAIDTRGTIGQVAGAKTKISALLSSITPVVGTLNSMVPLLPTSLGEDSPRTYAVMFQNPAESRALGGTALSFATITIDKGRIAFGAAVPAAFNFEMFSRPVLALPDGTEELYEGGLGTYIANVTSRPSFTTAAELTQEMWKRQFGSGVDGIISIDPVALSYVLRATSPIPLPSGDVLDSTTLVPLLLNTVYQRFNTGRNVADNLAQDVIYAQAVTATFSALTGGAMDPVKLVAALSQGWNEHRLLYWSAHPDEEARLVELGLNGEPPVSDSRTERVGVYFQDNVGSKMNFYLAQSVQLAQGTCRADKRENYRVTVTMTNGIAKSAVASLSPSIVGQWKREKLKPGVQRMVVLLYAPPGSTLSRATVNGNPVVLDALHDTDYPVGRVVVPIDPGASASVSYDFVATEPGTAKLDAVVTPMVNPTSVSTVALDCATVAE